MSAENNNRNNDLSSKIKFNDLANMFEKISNAKSITKKSEIIEKYIYSLKDFQEKFRNEYKMESNLKTSLYPVIRLILPKLDQTSFGIRTTTMGKLYTKILAIDPKSEQGKKLSGSSTLPSRGAVKYDYADTVYSVIKNRFKDTSQVTVYEINKCLDEISNNFHNNLRKNIEDDLFDLVNLMTAHEQKWFIRIILKSLNLGIGKQKVFSALSDNASEFFSKYSDLEKVCNLLENKESIQNDVVEVFSHIKPMLCGRIDLNTIGEACEKNEFYLENKMDGERFQLHIKNDEYRYFSRNGIDYSKTFGVDILEGTLTPFIHRYISENLNNAIFDGEMLVWDKEELIYRTKGENFDVKNLKSNHPRLRPCFCIFDVLFYNDTCLIDKPLAERVRILYSIITEHIGVITLCTRTKIKDSSHIIECLNTAIDNNEEGIVIKEINSIYKPNQRNGGWFKIKPDYIDGLVVEFDLIVIGGYYNRQRNFIKRFLVGILDDSLNKESPKFISFAEVSLGLKFDDLKNINNKLKSHWNDVECEKIGRNTIIKNPPNFELGKSFPDVWIDPKVSVVFEIKAAELVRSNRYGTKFTLRFPRILSIRDDKNWNDCCTMIEFLKLCPSTSSSTEIGVRKVSKRYTTSINDGNYSKKQRREKKIIIQPENIDKEIKIIDNICKELEFCILSTSKEYNLSINEMEDLVKSHGGKITKNPGSNTFVIIAGSITLRIKKLIEQNKYNIAKIDWFVNALVGDKPQRKLKKFRPNDMLSTTSDLKMKFHRNFDEFGDSYTQKISENELKKLFDLMDERKDFKLPILLNSELHEIEMELNYEKNFFRIYKAIFLNSSSPMWNISKLLFKYHGGNYDECDTVSDILNFNLNYYTHIFFDSVIYDINEIKKIDNENRLKIIDFHWIIDCDESNSIIK